MIDLLSSVWGELGWSVTWQTALALAVGLLAAATCARRPARADALLVAAVVAALAMPVGTFAVRRLGWGILVPHTPSTAAQSLITRFPPNVAMPSGESPAVGAPTTSAPTMAPVRAAGEPIAADALSPFAPRTEVPSPGEGQPSESQSARWRAWVPPILSTAWVVLSAAALLWLAGAVWLARRLLAASRRLHDARIDRALASAAERLKLNVVCEARVSAVVRCPIVWCWAGRPVILLPAEFVSSSDESAWPGIFCHELAHWKRRDHLSSLAVDLLSCVVPWQPLAWWVARRHAQLSEQACDEWVLACGQSAESYADSLLDLTPQRGARLALAVLRSGGGLAGRISHILDDVHAQPALGRSWRIGLTVCTFCFVTIAALAQQKPLSVGDKRDAAVAASATNLDSPKECSQHVSGVVLDVSGKPVAAARIYWLGLMRGDWRTLPRFDARRDKLELLAESVTDGQGRFSASATFEREAYRVHSVLVRLEGHGLGLESYLLAEQTEPLEIRLPDATPIRGRILDPNGMPVAGAVVAPVHLSNGSNWVALPDRVWRDELPTFWPKAVKTDGDGRFAIPGTDNSGAALLRVAAEGFGSHAVFVTDPETVAEWSKSEPGRDRSPPLANNFTLVLEPPRAIEGTFTDAQTGQPVSGVEIVLEADRHAGNLWNRQVARATSDDQGHYRFVAPASGREQHFFIYSPLGYALLGGRVYLEREFTELFGNGRVYRNDIQLKRGHIVRGRVIDADSRAPVADAAVTYRPAPGNPNIASADYWFHEPVLTDDHGRFEITALTGKGLIAVDTRSPDHIRTQIPPEIAGRRSHVSPHAFETIDVLDAREPLPLEFSVHRGTDLLVQPVGPHGKPVEVVQFAWREVGVPAAHGLRSRLVNQTPLRLRGCAPGKAYRLMIGTRSAELGAVADVTCDPASGPVTISLQPTGTLRGRLAYADGTPASEIHTFPHFDDTPLVKKEGEPLHDLPFYNNVLPYKSGSVTVTDANGEFDIRGIVPGIYLYLSVNYKFGSDDWPGGLIEPGNTLDLGELVIKP